MIDGVAIGNSVVPSGLAKVLLFVKAPPVLAKKGHCRISFSELSNISLGLQEVVLPSCVEKLMVKQSPTLIHLRHAKTFLCESLVRGCTMY